VIVLGASAFVVGWGWALRLSSREHPRWTWAGYATAGLFYLIYALRFALGGGTTRFEGAWRKAYLQFLAPHVGLTSIALLLGLRGAWLLWRARRSEGKGAELRFSQHDHLARMLDPVWILAAVTGIVAYAIRIWSPAG
jgi:uncharacterized membrane protein YozB (DUF420 family)